MPARVRGVRALQDGERGFEPEGRRGERVVEQVVQGLQREGGQLAHPVIQRLGVFGLRGLDGDLEVRLAADPMVDGGTVDAGVLGCGGDSVPLGQGGDDLSLNGRQAGI